MSAQIQNNNPLINIEQKLNILQSENSSLKIKIQSFLEKENLYKENLEKIKSIQSEQEKIYFNSIKDSKRREEIKTKIFRFSKIIRKSIFFK